MFLVVTPFHSRFSKYKIGASKVSKVYLKKCNVYQQQFHRNFHFEGHNGIEDLKITIMENIENVLELRRTEGYWQHRPDTFITTRLNEHFVGIPILYFALDKHSKLLFVTTKFAHESNLCLQGTYVCIS